MIYFVIIIIIFPFLYHVARIYPIKLHVYVMFLTPYIVSTMQC
jgi:hypothetical protein